MAGTGEKLQPPCPARRWVQGPRHWKNWAPQLKAGDSDSLQLSTCTLSWRTTGNLWKFSPEGPFCMWHRAAVMHLCYEVLTVLGTVPRKRPGLLVQVDCARLWARGEASRRSRCCSRPGSRGTQAWLQLDQAFLTGWAETIYTSCRARSTAQEAWEAGSGALGRA